ncbi:MAG: hypothetical protein L6R35_003803 [Caloplaca aegaea]|nr:MAG: hypothetical protein L6R35_003803 [Caloplaca aegaea]
MRLRKSTAILRRYGLLLFPTLAYAMNLDCSDIRDNKQSFDVSALGSPISVMTSEDHDPSPTMTNTTFTIDICKPLRKAKGIPKEEDCPNGSRVCGIQRVINTFENSTTFEAAIPIAGQYILHGGTELDPQITRFKTSSSPSDREKEGFRLQLHGPKYPNGKNGVSHSAVIEFLCQDKAEQKGERDLAARKGDDDDGEEEDHSATGEIAHDGHGGTLKYKDFALVDETKVLSLEWRTKYACENTKGGDDSKAKGSHWGFFTWMIIVYALLLQSLSCPHSCYLPRHVSLLNLRGLMDGGCSIFLATAAYLIFGSWLNYNRYSARGWDLVPHSETIRDIPYIFKDWMRRVLSTVQGGGSRGGYSAV